METAVILVQILARMIELTALNGSGWKLVVSQRDRDILRVTLVKGLSRFSHHRQRISLLVLNLQLWSVEETII